MIIFTRLVKRRKGVVVDCAVQGGINLGDYPHCLKPVGFGGFDVEDPPVLPADAGKDAEFVRA